jgi:Zn-dependent alcohol dehydrogenase
VQKIRAAVLERFGEPLAVQEVDLAPPSAGEVQVRLAAIDVDSFISHRLRLEKVNEGFDLMHRQDGIRSVIELGA